MKWREKTQQGVKKSREAWFGRLLQAVRRPKIDEGLWDELEETLLGADVGVATTTRLLERMKERAKTERVTEPETLLPLLQQEMRAVLEAPGQAGLLPERDGEAPKPTVVLVIGVNGVGKTTSIAKLAGYLQNEGKKVVLGAADTFRAAAIEQLQLWGQRVGVEVVAHRQGADPGAVAFDAYQAAKARGADVLIIDTAGRLHTKVNLMEEMKKISRVLHRLDSQAPHQVLLVLDATTGQNGLAQAQAFTEALGVTGIFVAKLDGTARGGILLSICDQLKLPVLFIGTGEGPDDLAPFSAEEFVAALLAASPQQAPS
ncbi:MAG: signal recognition particle-docking protein FtsY [Chloroflexi bacterium]|nr:signal recognition particle-docking protein FtsY [Chloroflexota bacterium]